MNNKISIYAYILMGLVYFGQGISNIKKDSIYYLMRENWGLSITEITLIGTIISIPWTIKPLFGFIVDCFPLFGKRSKYWLMSNYFLIFCLALYVYMFGLTKMSLILTGLAISYAMAFNDVCVDGVVCSLEKAHNLNGKLQSLSWASLSIAGLLTALGGAYIAKYYDYKLAFGIWSIFPLIMIFFLAFKYKESNELAKKLNKNEFKLIFKNIINPKLLFSMLFLFCLYLSPSLGTALRAYMREVMNIDKMFIGIIESVGTIFCVCGYILYFFKFHKANITKLLYFSIWTSALTTFCYIYLPSKIYLIGYAAIGGLVGGIAQLAILAYVAKITTKGYEAITFALLCSVLNLGGMCSDYFGGILYDKVGYSTLVIISGLFTLFCLVFIPKLKYEHCS